MKMFFNLGSPVSLDRACDTSMMDVHEFVLYRSEQDEEGERHVILLTLWQGGGVLGHTFAYAVEYEDTCETKESGGCPILLVGEVPPAYQDYAEKSVERWCRTFLSQEGEVQS